MIKVGDRVEVVKIVPTMTVEAAQKLERRWKGQLGRVVGVIERADAFGFGVKLDCEKATFGFYEEELKVIA